MKTIFKHTPLQRFIHDLDELFNDFGGRFPDAPKKDVEIELAFAGLQKEHAKNKQFQVTVN